MSTSTKGPACPSPSHGFRVVREPILFSLFVAVLLPACGRDDPASAPPPRANRPPVVTSINAFPIRIHSAEEIGLVAVASDADDDPLSYRWSASRGTFPLGTINPAPIWLTAEDRGRDTVTVVVTDTKDTITYSAVFDLALPLPPAAMRTINYESDLDVVWEASPDQRVRYFNGYRIYAADHSLAGVPLEDLGPYLARDVSASAFEFRIRVRNLPADGSRPLPGRRFYFHIRGYRKWAGHEEVSTAGEEVIAATRPSYTLDRVPELRASLGSWALDLSAGRARVIDPTAPGSVAPFDLYLGTTDANDGPGALQLKSVSELENRNPAWMDRVVLIKEVGSDWSISSTSDEAWSRSVRAETESVYAIRTPEGNYVKLKIDGSRGVHPERFVQVTWAYQPIVDLARF